MDVHLLPGLRCSPQYTVRGLSRDLWSAVLLLQHEVWKSFKVITAVLRVRPVRWIGVAADLMLGKTLTTAVSLVEDSVDIPLTSRSGSQRYSLKKQDPLKPSKESL